MTSGDLIEAALKAVHMIESPLDIQIVGGDYPIHTIMAGLSLGIDDVILAKTLGYDGVVCWNFKEDQEKAYMTSLSLWERANGKRRVYEAPVNLAKMFFHKQRKQIATALPHLKKNEVCQTAEMMRLSFVCMESPFVRAGEQALEAGLSDLMRQKKNCTPEEVLEWLLTLQEFQESEEKPYLAVRGEETLVKGLRADFSGASLFCPRSFEKLVQEEKNMLLCYSLLPEMQKVLEENGKCSVIALGRNAAQSVGMNVILDVWENMGLKIIRIGGLIY